jgi:uncharacterized protein involved in exopolysaccharide biosynthesis
MRVDLSALLGAVLSRWLRILLVTVLLLGATFAVLLFVPKLYESSASLLVEQRSNAFTRAATEQQTLNTVTIDAQMSSQIELIRSRDNLRVVIDELNLAGVREFSGAGFSPVDFVLQLFGRKPEVKSGDETVYENLIRRLSVLRQRDSAVISIFVQSQDRQLAADIANAIARSAVQRRADLSLSDTAVASDWLEQEIAKLRTRVEEAETAVANYKVDKDLFQSGTAQTSILDQQLSAIAAQITSAQERKNSAQSRANLIRGMLDAGQPIDGVADVRQSLVIQNLIQSKATLQGEFAQRSSTLLANHPTMKALRAQIASVDGQIAVEGRKVADALDSEARIEANLEQSLNDDLERLKLSVSDATRNTVTLDGLQREAKAQRDLLESYLARYSDAASRTDSSSALPDVRVVNLAVPSEIPASPRMGLILGAVAFLAVTLQTGAILFGELVSGRAIIRRGAPSGVLDDAVELDDEHLTDTAALTRADLVEPPDAPVAPAPAAAVLETSAEGSLAPEIPPAPPLAAPTLAPEPMPAPAPAGRSAGDAALELSNLAADIAIGRVRVVFLAAVGGFDSVERVARLLVDSALERGLSVATVDAGSGRLSADPGLTDLASDAASFGDVVHKRGEGQADIPWGRTARLERRSMKPVTLVEALTDIYEVVIVSTGAVDMFSALPVFSGVEGRLVLVSDEHHPDRTTIEASLAQSAALGYEVGQMVAAPAQRSVA